MNTVSESAIMKAVCNMEKNLWNNDADRIDTFEIVRRTEEGILVRPNEFKRCQSHKTLQFTKEWNGLWFTPTDYNRLMDQIKRYPKPFIVRGYFAHIRTPHLLSPQDLHEACIKKVLVE